MSDLIARLILATFDPETGDDLDPGVLASAPIEDVRDAVDEIGRLFSENNKLRAEVERLKAVIRSNDANMVDRLAAKWLQDEQERQ